MIKTKVCLHFAILILLVLTTNAAAQSDKAEELNLGNYFALLKSSTLPILDKFKNRDSLAKETDYPNSYMLLAHDEWKGWGEIALFKKTGGGHVVVVTQYDCQQTARSYRSNRFRGCKGDVHFLELKGKELVETQKFTPDLKKLFLYRFYEKKTSRLANGDDKLIFELPRERKDIIIKLAGEPVYSLVWNGSEFKGSFIE